MHINVTYCKHLSQNSVCFNFFFFLTKGTSQTELIGVQILFWYTATYRDNSRTQIQDHIVKLDNLNHKKDS